MSAIQNAWCEPLKRGSEEYTVPSHNGIRFFISMSRHIKFITIEHIPNAKDETLLNCIMQIKKLFAFRGFKVSNFLLDGQFKSKECDLAEKQIGLNLTSADEQVGDA